MTVNEERLEALKRGVTAAGDGSFVSISAKDLRWLIEQAERPLQPYPPFETDDEEDLSQ